MLRLTSTLAPLALCGACTLVLDPDNLPPQTDARAIDAPSLDADPARLRIDRVEPARVDEGVGDGGGRPALLVLHGEALVGGATVTATLLGGATPVALAATYQAGVDATQAGVAITVPVLPGVGPGDPRTIRIDVTQGATHQSIDVAVDGLPEATWAAGSRIASADIERYSRIEVTGPVHFTGAAPVRLEATADIRLAALVDGNASGATPGPHGCAGGGAEGAGACPPGGGAAGVNGPVAGTGGGGGGFGAQGTAGNNGGGAGGMPTGRDTLVPIVSSPGVAGNRGNGGGGGGKGLTVVAPGGPGGGGGGVIYLRAGGDITVSGGALEVRGGTSNGGSGGGGGGSGGGLLVRAGGTIVASGAWLAAPGGGASTGATNPGGAGSSGRIRIDAAAGEVAGMAVDPAPLRGPSWDRATPVLVDAVPVLVVRGQPGRALGLLVDGAARPAITPGADGRAALDGLSLTRGRHQLCAVAEPTMLVAESMSCVDVFASGR